VSSFACKLGGSIYMDGAVVQKKPDAEQRSANDASETFISLLKPRTSSRFVSHCHALKLQSPPISAFRTSTVSSIPRAIGVFVLCIGIGAYAVHILDTRPYNPDKTQTDGLTSTARTAKLLLTEPTKGSDDKVASRGGIRAKSSPPDQTILVLTMSTPEARYSYEKGKFSWSSRRKGPRASRPGSLWQQG